MITIMSAFIPLTIVAMSISAVVPTIIVIASVVPTIMIIATITSVSFSVVPVRPATCQQQRG
jgi:hypothetical protein